MDVTNGARLETYVIPGERGTGVIGINGAAAHLVHPGDLVILISYAQMDDETARRYQPRVVHVDADNRIIAARHRPGRRRCPAWPSICCAAIWRAEARASSVRRPRFGRPSDRQRQRG